MRKVQLSLLTIALTLIVFSTSAFAAVLGERTLQKGMSGADVAALQQKLSRAGYWVGAIDGKYGTNTFNAVIALQRNKGLTPDGVAGLRTLMALNNRELRRGMAGSDVVALQRKLREWGYAVGSIDGQFGYRTEQAVKGFQRNHGLLVNGMVGPYTSAALCGERVGGIRTATPAISRGSFSRNEIDLLARLIHAEAKGEPYEGQVAVGAVVLNRIKSSQFPNTMAGVIYQRFQFDVVQFGQINQPANQTAYKAAQDALAGWDPSYGSLYFYNPKTSISRWIFSRPVVRQIGNHVFAK